jgi:hypothetical protein
MAQDEQGRGSRTEVHEFLQTRSHEQAGRDFFQEISLREHRFLDEPAALSQGPKERDAVPQSAQDRSGGQNVKDQMGQECACPGSEEMPI